MENKLWYYRNKNNITLQELSRLSGISVAELNRIENGYTNDITYYFIVYFYNNSNINFCYQNRRERRHFRSL